jgi:hypothetical protein
MYRPLSLSFSRCRIQHNTTQTLHGREKTKDNHPKEIKRKRKSLP